MDFSQRVEFRHPGWILTIVEPLESRFVNVFVDIQFIDYKFDFLVYLYLYLPGVFHTSVTAIILLVSVVVWAISCLPYLGCPYMDSLL